MDAGFYAPAGCRINTGRVPPWIVLNFRSSSPEGLVLFLEGYTKQIYLNRAAAATGGPAWAIRVVNRNGRAAIFLAHAWKLGRSDVGSLEGKGGLGLKMLTPEGPAYWVETTMEITADVVIDAVVIA
jgi:hypothetical protein